jgi:hypothetical protein
MRISIAPVLILGVFGSCLLANNDVPQLDRPTLPKRDLTLLANPAAFPPSSAEIAKIKIRMLQAEHAAAHARMAAIEARIRRIREESEAQIKALREEHDALAGREKEISEALKTSRP